MSQTKSHRGPTAVDPESPSTLPEGWCCATIDQLSAEVRYGSSAKTIKDIRGDVIPVLRMGNVVDGRLDFTDLKYLPRRHHEFPELLLRVGDLLFNRTNSAELVGKTAVFQGYTSPASFASYLIRVRLLPGILPEYVSMYLNSMHGRAWVGRVASQQVGQANVNGSKLRDCVIPLPPNNEQVRIVAMAEHAISVADRIDASIRENLLRSNRLRQAILQLAFDGRLAERDPNDEPASLLLERVKVDRDSVPATAGRRLRTRAV